jgi:hypothetical protein
MICFKLKVTCLPVAQNAQWQTGLTSCIFRGLPDLEMEYDK